MENQNTGVFSKCVKAGKKRTYFFDVRTTKSNDYFLTITESRRRMDGSGYDKSKLFLYKEDFNKFLTGMQETIDYVKNELLPEYDFSAFDRDESEEEQSSHSERQNSTSSEVSSNVGDSVSEELNPPSTDSQEEGEDIGLKEEGEKW